MVREHSAKYAVLVRVVGRADKVRRQAEKSALETAATFKPALFVRHGKTYLAKWVKSVLSKRLSGVAAMGFAAGKKSAKEFADV